MTEFLRESTCGSLLTGCLATEKTPVRLTEERKPHARYK